MWRSFVAAVALAASSMPAAAQFQDRCGSRKEINAWVKAQAFVPGFAAKTADGLTDVFLIGRILSKAEMERNPLAILTAGSLGARLTIFGDRACVHDPGFSVSSIRDSTDRSHIAFEATQDVGDMWRVERKLTLRKKPKGQGGELVATGEGGRSYVVARYVSITTLKPTESLMKLR